MTAEQISVDESVKGTVPPPFDFNEIDFDAITKQVLADRPFGGAPKQAETYAFDDSKILPSDTKAIDREKQIEALRHDIAGMQ